MKTGVKINRRIFGKGVDKSIHLPDTRLVLKIRTASGGDPDKLKKQMKNKTVKQLVEESKDAALAAKTPAEIKAYIESIGCGTQHRWGKAVAAIIELGGVDYYAARGEQRAATADALRASVTHESTLFVDAKARCQRFAICDAAGKVVWYGIFFEDDQSFSYGDRNEQSACECAAARKAIWLASKIKESVGAPALRLTLKVDAQWLCTGGGKATVLQSDARRFNIELNLEWISGSENPADSWTTASGFKKWNDRPLAELATQIENACA